jgi:para-aminobenzoate synthetase component 1
VIVRDAPALSPEEAAGRAAQGADPVWLSSPGLAAGAGEGIAVDVVAADPHQVVRGAPLVELEAAWDAARERWGASPGEPISAGLPAGIGWFSYDLARRWMKPSSLPVDEVAAAVVPAADPGSDRDADFELRFFDALWIRAAGGARARIVACDERAARRLTELLNRPAPAASPPVIGPLRDDRPRAAHEAAVERVRAYLRAGDAYQVNLARRLTAPMAVGDPLWLAARLRALSPAPHAIWIGARSSPGGPIDAYVLGNSPERFLRVGTDRRIETQPIKGTRPRGSAPSGDDARRAELVAATKDRAEHVMIVDLERNDLGRVCETGSVTVEELMRVVALPTVFHLVSTVSGRLRPDVGLQTLLHACFPGGSVTGAPKRRAMEIIAALEPAPRGLYTGATGWLGAAGDLDLAIAIRTATVADGRLSLWVGGGIVVDSDPAEEWEETEVKARAFRTAAAPET